MIRVISDIQKEKARARAKKWYLDNYQKAITNAREYRARNLEERRQYERGYGREHSKEKKEYLKEYYNNNKAKFIIRTREYRATERGRMVRRFDNARRRFSVKETDDGSVNLVSISTMKKEQKNLCNFCHGDISEIFHIDHIKPLVLGGEHRIVNVQLLCPTCNLKKGASYESA